MQDNPAVVSLLATQSGISLGGQSVATLAGSTFSFFPEYQTYGRDPSIVGGPANGVRFLLYRTDQNRFLAEPLQTIGYVDLVNEAGSESVLTVRATVGGMSRADLRFDSAISGTVQLGAEQVPLSGIARGLTFALPGAAVRVSLDSIVSPSDGAEIYSSARIAMADRARPDSVILDIRLRTARCYSEPTIFLNGVKAAQVVSFGRFVVYGDTVVSDTLTSFLNAMQAGDRCGMPFSVIDRVSILLSPAQFAIQQRAVLQGELRVSVTTTGSGTDPDGYLAVTTEWSTTPWNTARWMPLPVNGTASMVALPAGGFIRGRDVVLTGLAPNCVPDGNNVRTDVTIPVGGTAETSFGVICSESPVRSGLLLFTTFLRFTVAGREVCSLRTVDANGMNLRELARDADCGEFAWSPDGTQVAYLRYRNANTLEAVVIDGSSIKSLGTRPGGDFGGDFEVRWSPDGSKVAVNNYGDIFIVNVADGTAYNLTQSPDGRDWSPAFSPDGTRIAFLSGFNVYAVGLDGSGFEKLTYFESDPVRGDLAWSPDGSRLLFSTSDSRIWVMNADGTGLLKLTEPYCFASCFRFDTRPLWSPDGAHILFTDGSDQMYVIDPDGTNLRRLTSTLGHAQDWSPDGSLIAFINNRGLIVTDRVGTWELATWAKPATSILRRARWQP